MPSSTFMSLWYKLQSLIFSCGWKTQYPQCAVCPHLLFLNTPWSTALQTRHCLSIPPPVSHDASTSVQRLFPERCPEKHGSFNPSKSLFSLQNHCSFWIQPPQYSPAPWLSLVTTPCTFQPLLRPSLPAGMSGHPFPLIPWDQLRCCHLSEVLPGYSSPQWGLHHNWGHRNPVPAFGNET